MAQNKMQSALYLATEAKRKALINIRAKLTKLILDDLQVQDRNKDSRFIYELFTEITQNQVTFNTSNLVGLIDMFQELNIRRIEIKQKTVHSIEGIHKVLQSIEQELEIVASIERNLQLIKQIVRES